jgi:hypothetical protein
MERFSSAGFIRGCFWAGGFSFETYCMAVIPYATVKSAWASRYH